MTRCRNRQAAGSSGLALGPPGTCDSHQSIRKGTDMKKLLMIAIGAAAVGLSTAPAWSQQGQHKAGDVPGPIDSLSDLQDTGRMLFKLADENNDGQISQKEATDAGNLLVGGFFFRADQNGDGVLSQDEAKQAREAFMSSKPWLRYV